MPCSHQKFTSTRLVQPVPEAPHRRSRPRGVCNVAPVHEVKLTVTTDDCSDSWQSQEPTYLPTPCMSLVVRTIPNPDAYCKQIARGLHVVGSVNRGSVFVGFCIVRAFLFKICIELGSLDFWKLPRPKPSGPFEFQYGFSHVVIISQTHTI